MILYYAWLVVKRFIVFLALWTIPTFIIVGAWSGSPAAGGVVALAVWAIAYRHKPYARCVRCDGAGRFWDVTKAYWRNCPRCGGGGRAYRAGHPMGGE